MAFQIINCISVFLIAQIELRFTWDHSTEMQLLESSRIVIIFQITFILHKFLILSANRISIHPNMFNSHDILCQSSYIPTKKKPNSFKIAYLTTTFPIMYCYLFCRSRCKMSIQEFRLLRDSWQAHFFCGVLKQWLLARQWCIQEVLLEHLQQEYRYQR